MLLRHLDRLQVVLRAFVYPNESSNVTLLTIFILAQKQHYNFSAIPPLSCHINAGILNGPICFTMCLKCWCKVNFLKIYIENKAFWWNRKYNTESHTSLYNLFQVLLSFNFALNVIYFTTITKQVIQLL